MKSSAAGSIILCYSNSSGGLNEQVIGILSFNSDGVMTGRCRVTSSGQDPTGFLSFLSGLPVFYSSTDRLDGCQPYCGLPGESRTRYTLMWCFCKTAVRADSYSSVSWWKEGGQAMADNCTKIVVSNLFCLTIYQLHSANYFNSLSIHFQPCIHNF